jgi:hypothetical protein
MRSFVSFWASQSPSPAVSAASMPTSTRRPRSILPAMRPSMVTLAEETRWSTIRMEEIPEAKTPKAKQIEPRK